MSTTIRELLTVLGVKTEAAGLKAFDDDVEAAKGHMEGAAKAAAILTGAVVLTAAAVAGLVANTVAAGSAVADGSARTALSAREYQTLGFAASQTGSSVEELETGIKKLNAATAAAFEKGEDFVDLHNGWKLALKGSNGEILTQAELMGQVADMIAMTTSQQERLAIAAGAFGERAGPGLVAALSNGSAGLEEMAQRAEALGLVMSDELVESADELGDRWDELMGIGSGLRNTIAEQLIPVINTLLRRFTEWYEANSKIIRQRLANWAAELGKGIKRLGDLVSWLDAIVQRTFGGWRPLILAAAGAIGVASAGVTAFAGLKAWLALRSALLAISGLISVIAGALGIGFWPATLAIVTLTAVVVAAAAAFAGYALIIEDTITYLRGGTSALGAFIEKHAEAEGVIGGFARWLRANLEELRAYGDLLDAIGAKFWEAFGPTITAIIDTLSSSLETLFGWITAVAGAWLGAKFDERAAATNQRTGSVRALTNSINGIDVGASAAVGVGAPSSSSSTTRSNAVTNHVSVSVPGGDPVQVEEAVRRALEFGNRQTMSALAGSEV